jgi:hypothetical protein
MFLQRFLLKQLKNVAVFFFIKLLNEKCFHNIFVKIIKNICEKCFLFIKLLMKNVFATFFVKIGLWKSLKQVISYTFGKLAHFLKA